ncbi:hypothetical protein JOQ06_027795, partial [Pogonophryne albipinna]
MVTQEKCICFPSALSPQGCNEFLKCEETDGSDKKEKLLIEKPGDATTTGTPGLLRFILVSVGLAALIVTVVTVHIWTRAKAAAGNPTEGPPKPPTKAEGPPKPPTKAEGSVLPKQDKKEAVET